MAFGNPHDESKQNKLTAALSAILASIKGSWSWRQAVMYPIERLSWLEKLTKTPRGPYFYYVLATIYSLPEIVFRLIYTAAHNLVGDIPILRQIVLLPLLLVGRVIMAITSPYRTVIERLIEYDSRKPEDTILSMKWPLIVLTTALVLAIVLLSIPTGLGPLAGVAAFLTTKLPLVAPLLSALTAAMATVMPLVAAQVLAALVTFAVGVTVLRNIANYLDNIISQKIPTYAFKAIFTGLPLLVHTNGDLIMARLPSGLAEVTGCDVKLESSDYSHDNTYEEMGIPGFPTLTQDLANLTARIKKAWKDWRTSGTQGYKAPTSEKSGLSDLTKKEQSLIQSMHNIMRRSFARAYLSDYKLFARAYPSDYKLSEDDIDGCVLKAGIYKNYRITKHYNSGMPKTATLDYYSTGINLNDEFNPPQLTEQLEIYLDPDLGKPTAVKWQKLVAPTPSTHASSADFAYPNANGGVAQHPEKQHPVNANAGEKLMCTGADNPGSTRALAQITRMD